MNKQQTVTLAETFPTVRRWLEGEERPDPPMSSADLLADQFGLDPFQRNILLLCAYAALEPEAGRLISGLHNDSQHSYVTTGLALARLPDAHWQGVAAGGALRGQLLAHAADGDGSINRRLDLAESVLFNLLGSPTLSSELVMMSRLIEAPEILSPNRMRLSEKLAAWLSPGRTEIVQLCGHDATGKEQAYARAAGRHGRQAYLLNAASLPSNVQELGVLARKWRRDLQLVDGTLLIDAALVSDDRQTSLFADLIDWPMAISTPEAINIGNRPSVQLTVPRMTAAEQIPVWREHLGPLAERLNGSVEKMSVFFSVSPEQVKSVAGDLNAHLDGMGEASDNQRSNTVENETRQLADIAWRSCRRLSRPRLDDLARRIESRSSWEDLILPPRQKRVLSAIAAQVRHRSAVYEEWGFGERYMGRGLGVSALFSGPSGAGKSMAGEVLGSELSLDVYRVDLSAIVSKWVGETEKNLRRVFDTAEEGSAILQFDEADALFGRRSEVKDSHDRHANIEVSYLLQRLEEYRGLTILTTNLRNNIDDAFMRRLRFVVDFKFPNLIERIAIWQRIFPGDTPLADVDFNTLGQLNVSGGSIRNIALTAAFIAAEEKSDVAMTHLYDAARLEYENRAGHDRR